MQRSELGQTRDPAALVPGDPGSVYRTAATMARFAMPLSAVGDDLRRIDDGGWTGQAAERFHEVFDPQPDRWLTAGAAFTEASEALVGYAHTLEWAQGQAADAIVLWDQAQDATRQAALGMLDQARQQLDDAGEHAARIVAQARDQVPARPSGRALAIIPTTDSPGAHSGLIRRRGAWRRERCNAGGRYCFSSRPSRGQTSWQTSTIGRQAKEMLSVTRIGWA